METTGETIICCNEQLFLSQQLLTITESIRTMAKNGQVEQITKKVKKRQAIISQLKINEKRLPAKNIFQKSLVDRMSSKDRNTISLLVNRFRKILEKIIDLDMEIRNVVNREKETIADDLKTVSTGHKLIKRYVSSRIDIPKYFSLSI